MTERRPALDAPIAQREDIRKHERRNALHTLVGMLELAGHDWAPVSDRVSEPLVRALLVGKTVAASERGIRLTVSETSFLSARQERPDILVRILGNLIDNAIDAVLDQRTSADDGRRIEVDLHEEAAVTELRVTDNGPGVPPGKQQWIFLEGASTKRHTDDRHRGLGLALVAGAVAELGGTVSVAERTGGGAVFTVRLPMASLSGLREAS